jgi:hypothetical protein
MNASKTYQFLGSMVFFSLAIPLHALRMLANSQQQDERGVKSTRSGDHSLLNQNSPSPNLTATTKQVDFGAVKWGLLIDGKDATKGPYAYDHSGFSTALESLDFVLHHTGSNDLTWELIINIHSRCCSAYDFRLSGMEPMSDFGCGCFQSMTCKSKEDAIASIPEDFLRAFQGEGCQSKCYFPHEMASQEVKKNLFNILEQYNQDAKTVPHEDKKQQTLILARFLRRLAWLHPFQDGNGRFRTLMLQRELRHRDIAHGAFMYNNNRDIYFISNDVYAAKIEEGIKMASLALETNSNPWVIESHVKAHLDRFPSTAHCHEGGEWGSVNFHNSNNNDTTAISYFETKQ